MLVAVRWVRFSAGLRRRVPSGATSDSRAAAEATGRSLSSTARAFREQLDALLERGGRGSARRRRRAVRRPRQASIRETPVECTRSVPISGRGRPGPGSSAVCRRRATGALLGTGRGPALLDTNARAARPSRRRRDQPLSTRRIGSSSMPVSSPFSHRLPARALLKPSRAGLPPQEGMRPRAGGLRGRAKPLHQPETASGTRPPTRRWRDWA